ncbi:MAG TPA: M48 family metallopeptidase [Noviherbaspirillum sp.]|jgi:Zn-dependent protease with chaperone function|uniref:M48 family metallopeptidase n=1 Tax=Noviherbaspirillum sp. TaxID=1926288 RepID=UPI002F940397
MNFFAEQEHARRLTRKLVFLFALSVLAIVAAVNAVLALAWSWTQTGAVLGMHDYPRGFFATNTGVTLALIGAGTLIEMFNLRDGGEAVARMAGGRPVPGNATDLQERRLLNVVEEMAIAAGIAVPRVYLLDREESINAFAAGYNRDEAVVAVTRGALTRLTRDELQGVVGHEFSHILNGDMRLNIRLIGLLFGIQMLAGFGRHLMDFGSYSWSGRVPHRKGPPLRIMLFLTGAGMLAVGYIGVFFGRMIKAAVSRQREFLADASAVQFTRSADGLGGALRKIAGLSRSMHPGSRIEHPNAEQLSHLFLGAPRPGLASRWLATHPPIEERLRRIYGRRVSPMDAPVLPPPVAQPVDLPDIPFEPAALAVAAAAVAVAAPPASAASTRLAPALDAALREPEAACALVHALLLDGADPTARLEAFAPRDAALRRHLASQIALLPKSARLPLLDLAMPALRQLDAAQKEDLLRGVERLIVADHRRTLAEFVLQSVLTRRLSPGAGRAVPVRYPSLSAIRQECIVLLSLVAQTAAAARRADAASLFAGAAALLAEPGLSSADLMPVSRLDYRRIDTALEHAHQLAPLSKPALVKALLAAAGSGMPLPLSCADLLRGICAALEAPVPDAVARSYPHFHWQGPS